MLAEPFLFDRGSAAATGPRRLLEPCAAPRRKIAASSPPFVQEDSRVEEPEFLGGPEPPTGPRRSTPGSRYHSVGKQEWTRSGPPRSTPSAIFEKIAVTLNIGGGRRCDSWSAPLRGSTRNNRALVKRGTADFRIWNRPPRRGSPSN
jgi:hypothetical protein